MKEPTTLADWRKSSYSSNAAECVEVSIAPDVVGIRDTKNRAAGHLTVSREAWSRVLDGVQFGQS